MSAIQGFMQILSQVWNDLFGLTSPFWGLTFKQIFSGLFVVLISIRVLFPLLGIGAGVLNNVTSLASRAFRSRGSSSRSSSSLPNHSTGHVSGSANSNPRYFNNGSSMYKRTK